MGNITHGKNCLSEIAGNNFTRRNININYPDIWGLYRTKKITPYKKTLIYSQKLIAFNSSQAKKQEIITRNQDYSGLSGIYTGLRQLKAFICSQKLAIIAYKIRANAEYWPKTRDKSLYLGILGYITYKDIA